MVVHIFHLSTLEAKTGESLSLQLPWPLEQAPGQPVLYRKTLSLKTKQLHIMQTNKRKRAMQTKGNFRSYSMLLSITWQKQEEFQCLSENGI